MNTINQQVLDQYLSAIRHNQAIPQPVGGVKGDDGGRHNSVAGVGRASAKKPVVLAKGKHIDVVV